MSLQYTSVLNETQYSQMKSLGTFEIQGSFLSIVPYFFHSDSKYNTYLEIGKMEYNFLNFFVIFYAITHRLKSRTFYMQLYSAHININLLYGIKLSMNKNAQKSRILPLLAISHWWIDISQKVTYFLIHLRTYDKNYALGL